MRLKTLIGITGFKGAGKDEAGNAFRKEGFEVVKFAGALKSMLHTYLEYVGVDPEEIHAMLEGNCKEQGTAFFGGKTPRHAMQTLGTEWGRILINKNLWVNACLDRCKQFEKVVVTDVRFPNEVDAIAGFGGKIIKIVRPGLTAEAHPSETAIDNLVTDFTIVNDQSISHLHKNVRNLLRTLTNEPA